MPALAVPKLIELTGFDRRRAVALANAKLFRALAWRALRDGNTNGALRAANARTAACIVIQQAKREALVNRMAMDALASDQPAHATPLPSTLPQADASHLVA
jgi:hypothetical protein